MRLLMLCVFIFIAGCAYNPAISKQARYDLEKPVDCSTAEEDIRILESEKASVARQSKAGAKMVAPVAAARAMLYGDYTDQQMVASGQYSDDIDSKIREIKSTCGMK